jgi:hypothetical protein
MAKFMLNASILALSSARLRSQVAPGSNRLLVGDLSIPFVPQAASPAPRHPNPLPQHLESDLSALQTADVPAPPQRKRKAPSSPVDYRESHCHGPRAT